MVGPARGRVSLCRWAGALCVGRCTGVTVRGGAEVGAVGRWWVGVRGRCGAGAGGVARRRGVPPRPPVPPLAARLPAVARLRGCAAGRAGASAAVARRRELGRLGGSAVGRRRELGRLGGSAPGRLCGWEAARLGRLDSPAAGWLGELARLRRQGGCAGWGGRAGWGRLRRLRGWASGTSAAVGGSAGWGGRVAARLGRSGGRVGGGVEHCTACDACSLRPPWPL